jgi:lysophospholipase L1-like esterase
MKLSPIFLYAALSFFAAGLSHAAEKVTPDLDWAKLGAYRSANSQTSPPVQGEQRIIFMGDSITEFWSKSQWNAVHINRGISGQTTPQMLLRFRQDVIDLRPTVVVILAGTNDVAGNTGPATNEMIAGNITSMLQLAKANEIKVVLASVLPASGFSWNPEARPAQQIVALNEEIKKIAKRYGCVYLDYFTAMVNSDSGLKHEYSEDGVHPNESGYSVMSRLAEGAIASALRTR